VADLVIRGGTVCTPTGLRDADVHISGGRITSLERSDHPRAEDVDARGLLVLPGGIDAHVHSRDPGFPEKEDFASLTAAAAAGGITTVVDMPNSLPAVENAAVFQEKVEVASARARVDFALWGLMGGRSRPEDVAGLLDAGAVGLKAFLGYAVRRGNRQVVYTPAGDDSPGGDLEAPPGYGAVARLAPDLARRGAPLAVHCEDPDVLRQFERPELTYADLLASRPALAEAVAIAALGVISQRTGLEVHVVHLSSALGLAAARDASRAGARLVLETCPQYLWLCDEDAGRLGPLLKMFPPVRTAADRAALREALWTGVIGRVGTDHAPHTDREKVGRPLAETLPGSPGVETLYLSCLELARARGDVAAAARWVAEGPARALRLHPRKGVIMPGADADLVLVDPAGETVVVADRMHSRQRLGVFEGRRFGFALRAAYSRGELVADEGEPVAAPGRGRLVRP
jgi:dihydroorotase